MTCSGKSVELVGTNVDFVGKDSDGVVQGISMGTGTNWDCEWYSTIWYGSETPQEAGPRRGGHETTLVKRVNDEKYCKVRWCRRRKTLSRYEANSVLLEELRTY